MAWLIHQRKDSNIVTESSIRQSFCTLISDGNEKDLTPLQNEYKGQMNGGILSLEIHQSYKNETGSQESKAVLCLPRSRNHCLTAIEYVLNGEKINLKLESKETAQEIVEEAEKEGRSTITARKSKNDQTFLVDLGLLPNNSICEITLRFEIVSSNTDPQTLQTIIPFPILKSSPPTTSTFSCEIEFTEVNPIESVTLLCGQTENIDHTFENNKLTITKQPLGPLVALTKLQSSISSTIQNDDKYTVVSVLPQFTNDTINSDFLFVIDCSGSMSGSRIRNAAECLSIFLHSLPIGCKFNIIKFGSQFTSLFQEGLVEYNEENLLKAEELTQNLKANMGGTNLLGPLSEAYRQALAHSDKGNVVQIFLLTDGDIYDKETVFRCVKKNRTKNRIFSIGIGNEADTSLVSGLSLLSYGQFDFVSESTQITEKVMRLLEMSLSPSLTNVSVHVEGIETLEFEPNPVPSLYNNHFMTFYIKRPDGSQPIENVLITGNIGTEDHEIVIDQSIKSNPLSARNLFSYNAISDFEQLYDEQSKTAMDNNALSTLKSKIVALSIESGIISSFTSYVGVQKDAPVERNEAHQQFGIIAPSMAPRFAGVPMMRCQMQAPMCCARPPMAQPVPACAKSQRPRVSTAPPPEIHEAIPLGAAPAIDHFFMARGSASRGAAGGPVAKKASRKMASKTPQPHITGAPPSQHQAPAPPPPPPQQGIPLQTHNMMELAAAVSPQVNCYSDNTVIAKPPQQPAPQDDGKIKNTVNGIISVQKFDGRWDAAVIDELLAFVPADAKEAFNNLVASLNLAEAKDVEDVKATLAALFVFHKQFSGDQSRWKLVQAKAVRWLKSRSPSTNWETEIAKF